MTMNVRGYATPSVKAALAPYQFVRRDTRADDVVIDILYCGICHSDLHHVNNDWGRSSIHPMVPGHEIIGRVASVGSDVASNLVIMLVSVAWLIPASIVQYVSRGWNSIAKRAPRLPMMTDRHDQMPNFGGYSEKIIVREKFILCIPDGLDLKGAGPLLCAGITSWSLLRHWRVGKGTNVRVVGLGGLGHMVLKLAKALGANVTLFSRSPGKEQDARRLGADNVVMSTDAGQMTSVNNKLDLIIDTVPYVHDLNPYLPSLSLNGKLVLVGFLGNLEPTLNTVPLIMRRNSVAGSVIGGIAETQELLDFCGEHGITADVEVIKIQDINEAYKRMLKSDVKYRFVIDMASLKS